MQCQLHHSIVCLTHLTLSIARLYLPFIHSWIAIFSDPRSNKYLIGQLRRLTVYAAFTRRMSLSSQGPLFGLSISAITTAVFVSVAKYLERSKATEPAAAKNNNYLSWKWRNFLISFVHASFAGIITLYWYGISQHTLIVSSFITDTMFSSSTVFMTNLNFWLTWLMLVQSGLTFCPVSLTDISFTTCLKWWSWVTKDHWNWSFTMSW